jgi:2-iminoacetate synthase ThiH
VSLPPTSWLQLGIFPLLFWADFGGYDVGITGREETVKESTRDLQRTKERSRRLSISIPASMPFKVHKK